MGDTKIIARIRKIEDRNSVAIVSIGDSANSKINARVRDIEDRDSVANVIVNESYISPHQRTNVAIVICCAHQWQRWLAVLCRWQVCRW